jgi:nitrite reductase/ring-hydroxylating ferredoxin subunit/alkylhydroperoxidase/carboxymuconolactone decarboxylase family protein YurZ
MSKALDYLMHARPEAMRHYFRFLKAAGQRLDPKIRAIISVITKVDRQTATGFRQYLKRALREGVTADEILDALLLAFPTLGLSKITWAMDQLLELDLPEFRLENLGPQPAWHDVADTVEITPEEARCFEADGKLIFVYASDSISVYDNRCPHQATLIESNRLAGCYVTCPKHGWKFDLRTGDCVEVGNLPLMRLQHEVKDGRLYVYW